MTWRLSLKKPCLIGNKIVKIDMKQVLLLMTNRCDLSTVDKMESLMSATNIYTDFFILYNATSNALPKALEPYKEHIYSFTSDILYTLGYMPLGDSLVYGNCHFPVLKFFLSHQEYDFFWTIEDDVIFTGDWNTLFDHYKEDQTDFISAFIRTIGEDPQWGWWNSLYTNSEPIDTGTVVAAFNPIYRMSNRALQCLHKTLLRGWRGHAEVIVSTIMSCNRLSIKDMGGTGRFVSKGEKDLFYTHDSHSYQALKIQPFRPNTIYHPIKQKISSKKLRNNCVISVVGRNSLHKKWLINDYDRTFDLHLIVYDESFSRYYNDADFLSFRKGYKLRLVYDYLNQHPEYLKHYSYFFIPDDDIDTDAYQIERLFNTMEEFKLQIAQPSLRQSYCTFPHTLQNHFTKMRYTTFVEMMLPCFSSDALHKVLETFNANESGWGIEYHWALLINSNKHDMAIIDDIPMIHTRPIQTGRSQNIKEMKQYMSKYNLTNHIEETGYLSLSSLQETQSILTDLHDRRGSILASTMDLAHTMIKNVQNGAISRPGLNGILSVSLFLYKLAVISENIQYKDIASVFFQISKSKIVSQNELSQQSFISGYLGYLWSIKHVTDIELTSDMYLNSVKTITKTSEHLLDSEMLGFSWLELSTIPVTIVMQTITKHQLNVEKSDTNVLLYRSWDSLGELYFIEARKKTNLCKTLL